MVLVKLFHALLRKLHLWVDWQKTLFLGLMVDLPRMLIKGYKQVSGQYEANATPDDFDWGRLTGNVVSPVNWMGVGAGGAATGLGGKMAVGAGMGASSAAAMPVENTDNYWEEKS